MKIELDNNAKQTVEIVITWLVSGFVACVAMNFIYRYNSIVYEKGYTQKALPYQSTTQPVWVKE
jgi:uncharacterized protein YifN (PemK superfamily)